MIEFIVGILVYVFALLLAAFIVWMFWPTIMVAKFGLPALAYGEAVVLCVLGGCITGGR